MAKYEVIVVGGGPSGVAAALAGARRGAKTLLIERYGFLGGMATSGLVGPFMPVTYDGKTRVTRGIFQEIVNDLVQRKAAIPPEASARTAPAKCFRTDILPDTTPFDPEELKWLLQEKLMAAGVNLICHSTFARAQVHAGKIESIVCQNKEGLAEYIGDAYIDCTGDGDLAAAAGVPYQIGRNNDGMTQPATLMFRVGGVDFETLERYIAGEPSQRRLDRLVAQARQEGLEIGPRNNFLFFRTTRTGEVVVNTTRVHQVNGIDSRSLTEAEVEARRQVRVILEFLRKYAPGFQTCYLTETATQIGIRETRRITGEYVVSEKDVLEGVKFTDAIARACYMIDLHSPTGGDTEMILVKDATYYEIPFRALYNRQITNLIWAGRCVSATHVALAALRIMPTCFATGEAAGAAAAIASQSKQDIAGIDPERIRESLRENGAWI